MSALPGIKYFSAVATEPNGRAALAIAHMGPDGPVLDECCVFTVMGGESGIDELYRGLRAAGIEIDDDRAAWTAHGVQRTDAKERAIRRALDLARAT